MNPDFAALLADGNGEPESASDIELRDALEALAGAATGHAGSGWDRVRSFLSDFGAASPDDGAPGTLRPG